MTQFRLALRLLAVLLALALAAPALASAMPVRPGGGPVLAAATSPTVGQLVGQKLVVAMSGTSPSASLLGRVQRGEVGGVILFGSNIGSAQALVAATRALQAAAAAGGQPKLLIATDQEGGAVKRIPWAPPTLSPAQMTAQGTAAGYAQGQSTAHVLVCGGVNSDLAPVADVPASTSSFIYQQGRAWSFSASTTAAMSDAFARGLVAGLGVPAMKHFPGLGFATQNTDSSVVTITASKAALAPGLTPYQTAIGHGIPMIMLSNATYTAYDAGNAAGWSSAIGTGLLRTTLGFRGVTITDSLTGTAAARGVSPTSLAIRAAAAGTDMLLLTGSESSTSATYTSLVAAAGAGTIPLARLQASYSRILALKGRLRSPAPDTTAPSVARPVSRLTAPATLGTATTPVVTRWSAADPCAVAADALERQANSSLYTLQALPSPRSTSVVQSLTPGIAYRYAARATDGAGNTSGWASGATYTPWITQQTSSAVTFTGTWRTAYSTSLSGGSLAYSSAAGASATFRFTGMSVSWVSYRGPQRGSAAVYVDGVYRATIRLGATTYQPRQVVYAASWGSVGTHTLRIVNLGGSAGSTRVDVDAFVRLTAR